MKINIIILILALFDVIIVHVLSECTTTDGSSANSVPCTCGSETCDATTGLICYSTTGGGSCRPNDFGAYGYPQPTIGNCIDVIGRAVIEDKASCEAAASSLGLSDITVASSSGEYSFYPPGCFLYYGALKFNTLSTSTTSCSTNSDYCICVAVIVCATTDGTANNNAPCLCGTSTCTTSTGYYCTSSQNKCAIGPPCANTNGLVNNNAPCACG